MRIQRVELVVRGDAARADAVAREGLRREFPSVPIELVARPHADAVLLDAHAWANDASIFGAFDDAIREGFADAEGDVVLRARPLAIDGPAGSLLRSAEQILTRYQRLLNRRNAASCDRVFDELLARHRARHSPAKPLVRADFEHALDTWQWMLRLDPNASAAAQVAALLHDIERLDSEADVRVEHLAEDYGAFKRDHAAAGAQKARALLSGLPLPEATRERAVWLIAHHEAPNGDDELALLNDADGLSFFSHNSAGYVDYFGPAVAARKIRYTLARLGAAARARLPRLRYRADVARLLHSELVGGAPPYSRARATMGQA